ncbi:MAG TPA: hypothetical protein VGJ50_34605 [Streptosporangiaceae bacterium]|jgi:hypothetical protein
MAENDLVRLRPSDLAKVWGTAFGQLIDLWRTALTAVAELGSGEQTIPGVQSDQFSLPSADGRMPRLAVRNLVGETFRRPLDGQAVKFTQKSSGPGPITVEYSIDEKFRPSRGDTYIEGDIYTGQVVDEGGKVVATIRLDAGS